MKKRDYYTPRDARRAFLESVNGNDFCIVYDLETTGLEPEMNHVIQVSARKCFLSKDGLAEAEARCWYINPGYMLPDKITELTGITDEFLVDKPREEEVFPEIREFFGDECVCGYNNRRFDDLFMRAMYGRYGAEFAPADSIDLYRVVREAVPPAETANQKLSTIAGYFRMPETQFHNAESDTAATLFVFNRLVPLVTEQLSQQSGKKDLLPVSVTGVSYWESPAAWGKRPLRYIFVDTKEGVKFFFDKDKRAWAVKDVNDRIERYDAESLARQAFKAAGVADQDGFERFTGRVRAQAY